MRVSHTQPRPKADAKVKLCLTASQSVTLWYLLEGVRARQEFNQSTMHRLLCIQHRLQVAMLKESQGDET